MTSSNGPLVITLPAGVALSQHDIYIERSPLASLPPGVYQNVENISQTNTFGLVTPQMVIVPTEGPGTGVAALNTSDANAILAAAKQLWINAHVPAADFAGISLKIDTLPANVAAETSDNQITLSADGAGWGWNTDANSAPAANKLDLLTVILEQLGIIVGIAGNGSKDDVMNQVLEPGVRRLPGPYDILGKNKPVGPSTSESQQIFNVLQSDVPVYSDPFGAAPAAPSTDTLVTTFNAIDVFQPASNFQQGANPQPVLLKTVTADNQANR